MINISNGKKKAAYKTVIYGVEGIGKTTLASKFPDPLFIDTEGSTERYDVKRIDPAPRSWPELMNILTEIKNNPGVYCKTLVIDTADWAERMCIAYVCFQHEKKSIESFGYGNGYVYTSEEFGRFLDLLTDVRDSGTHVVVVAHAQVRKFELPNEAGAFDKYELKLGKKTSSITSPMLREWADMVLFCNYLTHAVATDDQGKKHKAQGGRRVMYTTHHPCWDAKNRDNLPEMLDLDFKFIAHLFTDRPVASTAPRPAPVSQPVQQPIQQPAQISQPIQQPVPAPQPAVPAAPAAPVEQPMSITDGLTDDDEINWNDSVYQTFDPALLALMKQDNVPESDIRKAIALKGFAPEEMPIANYPPDFINGVLIGGWADVLEFIHESIWHLTF